MQDFPPSASRAAGGLFVLLCVLLIHIIALFCSKTQKNFEWEKTSKNE